MAGAGSSRNVHDAAGPAAGVGLSAFVTPMAMLMGNSQAIKAMWVEDTPRLIPSGPFFLGVRYRGKPQDKGFRRAVLVGFMCASVALFGVGLPVFDSILKLVKAEHPGRMKLPLARKPHDKTLHVSAILEDGGRLSHLPGAAGLIGLAYGLSWPSRVETHDSDPLIDRLHRVAMVPLPLLE